MQTINISLPSSLASKIDSVVQNEGYSSRSEFVRALIRFYMQTEEKINLTLTPFKRVSLERVEKEMRKTGKYNEKFIRSVIGGLEKSSIYAQN